MKCVITDGFWQAEPEKDIAALQSIVGQVDYYASTTASELYERAQDAEMLIVNKVIIGAEQMDALPKLKYVGVAATGYNVVDVVAAKGRGIVVTNVPAYSTDSVAQTVFAYILDYCQRVSFHGELVRGGAWAASPYFSFWRTPLYELAGKTLGIVGLGRIGLKVAEIGHAFGMRVLGASRSRKSDLPDYVKQVDVETVLRESDFVSLHCPLTDASRHLINSEALSKMKPTAFLVNTSRGPVVDEVALAAALEQGVVAGAAVDVLAQEPPSVDNPLTNCAKCVVTPHFAWATLEARGRLFNVILDNVRAFVAGTPINVVS